MIQTVMIYLVIGFCWAFIVQNGLKALDPNEENWDGLTIGVNIIGWPLLFSWFIITFVNCFFFKKS